MGLRAAWIPVEEGEAGIRLRSQWPLLLFQFFFRLSFLWLLLNQNHWSGEKLKSEGVLWYGREGSRTAGTSGCPPQNLAPATQPQQAHSHSCSLSGSQVQNYRAKGLHPVSDHGRDTCNDLRFWTTCKQFYLFSFNLLPEEFILACSLTFTYFLFDYF